MPLGNEKKHARALHGSLGAAIFTSGNRYWIERTSTSEIYINGKVLAVGEKELLSFGDRIQIAGIDLLWDITAETPNPRSSEQTRRSFAQLLPPAWLLSNYMNKIRGTERIEPKSVMAEIRSPVRPCPALPHIHVLPSTSDELVTELTEDRAEKRDATLVWRVGSARDCSILIDIPGVSGLHACVVLQKGRWRVIDQLSQNGLFINGEKSTVRYLSSGDRLRLGTTDCVIHLPRIQNTTSSPRGQLVRWLLVGLLAFLATLIGLLVLRREHGWPHAQVLSLPSDRGEVRSRTSQ